MTKTGDIEAPSYFENGKRTLALAHALRASHSGGSTWVEQTRQFVFIKMFGARGVSPLPQRFSQNLSE